MVLFTGEGRRLRRLPDGRHRVGQEWSRVSLGHSRIFYLSSVFIFIWHFDPVTLIPSYLLPYSVFLSPVSCVWEPATAPRSRAP